VSEIEIDIAFWSVNIVLLAVAIAVLARVYFQVRQLSRETQQLKEAARKVAGFDRGSASQIARIAREISADLGKLRQLDSSDDGAQFQSLH